LRHGVYPAGDVAGSSGQPGGGRCAADARPDGQSGTRERPQGTAALFGGGDEGDAKEAVGLRGREREPDAAAAQAVDRQERTIRAVADAEKDRNRKRFRRRVGGRGERARARTSTSDGTCRAGGESDLLMRNMLALSVHKPIMCPLCAHYVPISENRSFSILDVRS